MNLRKAKLVSFTGVIFVALFLFNPQLSRSEILEAQKIDFHQKFFSSSFSGGGVFFRAQNFFFEHASAASVLASTDRPAIHGMLLVGNQTMYLSHLPMFHAPHDYQIIIEVGFVGGPQDAQQAYVKDRLSTRERVYTVVPTQPFILPNIVQNKISFPATVFRGHFERGGHPLFNTMVNIKKVVYFHKFNPTTPRLNSLKYFLFGSGVELFLAHLISVCPDFDQVLAIATAHPVPPQKLDTPILLNFAGRPNTAALKEGEVATAQIGGTMNSDSIKVLGQFYLETGDLACSMGGLGMIEGTGMARGQGFVGGMNMVSAKGQ